MHHRVRLLGATAAVALLVVCAPPVHRLLAQSFESLQSPESERFLAEAPMRLGKTLSGVTRSRQAILELNGVSHFAVWKTIDDVRKGVTNLGRGGYEINFSDTWKNEVPAYELDKLLGLKMVPVAVSRTYRNTPGALIAWVDLGMSEADRLAKQLIPPNPSDWSQKMANVQLFDNLIYNIDRHANNIYITTDWNVILIDHSRSFRSFSDLRTENELRRFSKSLLTALEKLDRNAFQKRMSKYLDGPQVESLFARRDAILARARRLVQEQGEAAVLFP